MSSQSTTPKQTGGGGFQFENKVGAYFLSFLLAGKPPFEPELGIIKRLDFQVLKGGWLLDDLLLTLESSEIVRRCAFSIKSNKQITKNGAPSDFVNLIWRQYLHENTDKFNSDLDYLGLISKPFAQNVRNKLDVLLNYSQKQDSENLNVRLKDDSSLVEISSSFNCPADLASKYSVTEKSIGELLSHLLIIDCDFDTSIQTWQNTAFQNCQDTLKSGSPDEARNLWESLLIVSQDYDSSGGGITYIDLINLLRSRFKLKHHPVYDGDWRILEELKNGYLSSIKDTIGKNISIHRNEKIVELKRKTETNSILIIIGVSGIGKTVLAKHFVEDVSTYKTIWLPASSFLRQDYASFENSLNLSYSLAELINIVPEEHAYFIIDSFEQLRTDEAKRNLRIIIKALKLGNINSPWKLLITYRAEDLSQMYGMLRDSDLPLEFTYFMQLGDIEKDESKEILNGFPSLEKLAHNPNIRNILKNPKFLDLIITRLQYNSNLELPEWIGESHLIDWYWETAIKQPSSGMIRDNFLQKLSQIQADKFETETPLIDFQTSELSIIDELKLENVCREQNEQISFFHDILGDWARQRILISKSNSISEIIKEKVNYPSWHRAIRLYCHHLLENNRIEIWSKLLDDLSTAEQEFNLSQDIVLDSVIYTVNELSMLESIWPQLIKDKGVLLRRLLNRFLHIATYPNPIYLTIAHTFHLDKDLSFATLNRVPYWPYWLPLLELIDNHKSEAKQYAMKQVSELADIWLRQGAKIWPLRKEIAQIALDIANNILEQKLMGPTIVNNKIDNTAYRAALAGVDVLPNEVAEFALRACKRKVSQLLPKSIRVQSIMGTYESEIPAPWPRGPLARPDHAFRDLCLGASDHDTMYPLILSMPHIAREVILALLIEEPKPSDPFEYRIRDTYEIVDMHGWFPPFYTHGTFYFFLKSNVLEGVGLILDLVNFATERWAAYREKEEDEVPGLEIEIISNKRIWLGDGRVYFWYRGEYSCPQAVASALMALEKYLTDEIDSNKSINTIIDLILKNAKSLAFIGLLISITKKDNSLLKGQLKDLIRIPEIHLWEMQYFLDSHSYQLIGWATKGEYMLKLAQEWQNLKHRTIGFDYVCLHFFVSSEDMKEYFEDVLSKWRLEYEALEDNHYLKNYLEKLIAQYDSRNWQKKIHPQYGECFEFVPPKELREKSEKYAKDSEMERLLLYWPMQCSQILKDKLPLKIDELESIWPIIQKLYKMELSADLIKKDIKKEDAICGCIAVIFILQREWLRDNLEYENWCINYIIETIKNPIQFDVDDSSFSITYWTWDYFCALVIPYIWAEDTESKDIRNCMLLMLRFPRYSTVQALFKSAIDNRVNLGLNLNQIQNYILAYSGAKWLYDHTKHLGKSQFKLDRWFNKEKIIFIKNKYPKELLSWDKLMPKDSYWNRLIRRRKYPRQYSQLQELPNLDLYLIQNAFSYLPDLKDAIDDFQRTQWIKFWKESLNYMLAIISERTKDNDEINGTPYDWDRWVLRRISRLLLELDNSENQELFWKPILDLGCSAHYWINDYFQEWFNNGLNDTTNSKIFLSIWSKMFEHADSSPKWSRKKERKGYYCNEIWCSLMGFDYICMDIWSADKATIVKEMKDYFARWANRNLLYADCIKAFATFLKQPAAILIRLDGIIWLDIGCKSIDTYYWEKSDFQEKLVSLLSACWKDDENNIRNNQDVLNSFNNLLNKLVELQNQTAMELHDLIINQRK